MSGPINSLKKTRRVPFKTSSKPDWSAFSHTSQNSSFVGTSIESDVDNEIKELASEVSQFMAQEKMKSFHKKTLPQIWTGSKSIPNEQLSSDHEVLSLMMTKITQLEKRVHEQNIELSTKKKKIAILKEKVTLFQDTKSSTIIKHLEEKCANLQNQIFEMENFLADYGLIWVGETASEDDAADGEANTEKSINVNYIDCWNPSKSLPYMFHMDFDKVLRNIRELNELAGEAESKVEHTARGARLKRPDPVSLTLYANGIIMFNGPFRSYDEPETQHCMSDIMDGYFPSELQSRFPDGVPFAVTDNRAVFFKDRFEQQITFQGDGQRLGGNLGSSKLLETDKLPSRPITMNQFLNQLPQSIIKAGKVIDIRNSVGQSLRGVKGETSQCTVINTEDTRMIQERLQSGDKRQSSDLQVATLRVKVDGKHHESYVLRMKFSDTIGQLRRHLADQRCQEMNSICIMTTFPKCVLEDDSKTLEECKLVPNAVLHMKA